MATVQVDISIRHLLMIFLQGSGIPCHELFDMVKAGFSPLINLSQIDSNSFQSCIFIWAVTRCPHLGPASDPIIVSDSLWLSDVSLYFLLVSLELLLKMTPLCIESGTGNHYGSPGKDFIPHLFEGSPSSSFMGSFSCNIKLSIHITFRTPELSAGI